MLKIFFEKYPSATLPAFLFFITLGVVGLWMLAGEVRYNLVLESMKSWTSEYGLWALALGSAIETLFMIGVYLPGSLVIVMAVGLYGRDFNSLFQVFLCINIAALITNIFNFYIGKTGMYKTFKWLGAEKAIENAKKQMESYGDWSIFLSGIHPNLLGIMIAYAGLSGKNFFKTMSISLFTTIVWVPILMILTILFTNQLLTNQSGSWLMMPTFFAVWALIAIIYTETKSKYAKNI